MRGDKHIDHKKKDNFIFPGQVSIFDFLETINTETIRKSSLDIKIPVLDTKIAESFTNNCVSLSKEHESVYKKFMDQGNVSRIIKHCCGALLIETVDVSGIDYTHYINKVGEEENNFLGQAPVLPMDTIIHYSGNFNSNSIQDGVLQQVLKIHKGVINKVIKRTGDFNILIELKDKVIGINQLGWVLPFINVSISYKDAEVIQDFNTNKKTIETVGKGSIIEYWDGKSTVEGIVTHVYGNANESLCIDFDNRTKNTAIFRGSITKIVG